MNVWNDSSQKTFKNLAVWVLSSLKHSIIYYVDDNDDEDDQSTTTTI